MADNYLSGKVGAVGVATASSVDWGTGTATPGTNLIMSFGEWRMPIESGTPEISNFNTAPYRAYVPGLIGATAETDCPGYNQSNMPLTCGNAYVVTLYFDHGNSISISGTAILKKLEPGSKADGAATVKASWQFTGSMSISIT